MVGEVREGVGRGVGGGEMRVDLGGFLVEVGVWVGLRVVSSLCSALIFTVLPLLSDGLISCSGSGLMSTVLPLSRDDLVSPSKSGLGAPWDLELRVVAGIASLL